jgi:hypothetical protein
MTFLVAWSLACFAALVSPVIYRVFRGDDRESMGAAWISMTAVIPGIALLVEVLLRLNSVRLGTSVLFAPYSMVTLVPACGGLLLGIACFVASGFALPLTSGDRYINAVRLIHLIAWALSVLAAAFSVVAV